MKKRFSLLPISMLFGMLTLSGQTDTLFTLAHYDESSLKLRWSIGNTDILALGFQYGYTLTIEEMDGTQIRDTRSVNVMPLSDDAISTRCKTDGDTLTFGLFKQSRDGTNTFTSDPEAQKWNRLIMLFGIQDNFPLSKAMGLAYELENPNTPATYRVRVAINHPRNAQLLTQVLTIPFPTVQLLDPPLPPICICKDNRLSITGDLYGVDDQYSSFHILRRQDSTSAYQRRSPRPLLANYAEGDPLVFYIDTIGKEGIYDYVLQGKDIWGEYGPYSRPEYVLPCHIIYAPPRLYADEVEERGKSKLNWEIPDSLLQFLEGFDIYRSEDKFNGFEKINETVLPVTQRTYMDDEPLEMNFYYVQARYHRNITSNSLSKMVALIDTRPPGIPQNVQVEFDTSTFISKITWSDLADPDLKGYRIFFSPEPDGNKFLLYNLELENNYYIDTLDKKTLYMGRTYWVTSRDLNQNESFYSDSVSIALPDRFPPTAARITNVEYDYNYVQLTWEGSPSKDVVQHTLEWKTINESTWQEKSITPSSYSNLYRDSMQAMGDTLLYRIRVVDTAGLTSYSNVRKGWLLPPIFLPDLDYIETEVRDTILALFFDYPDNVDIDRFQIMSGSNESEMTTWGYVYPQEHMIRQGIKKTGNDTPFALYQWDRLLPTSALFLKIRAISEEGKVSRFSTIHQALP